MKKFSAFLLTYALACAMLGGCAAKDQPISQSAANAAEIQGTAIVLSDEGITVDGAAVGTDATAAVYTANDIVYYEAGKDFTYGEGTDADAHSAEEAGAHTVVHITQPGTYVLSGKLSQGQIAVDLGDEAETDPESVVTLVLNDVDITCSVAPAVIFYNVYECGSADTETATKDVDTTAAGANVLIADGTVNNIYGAYVARIYKPESVVLSADGTKVEEAKKLHKYDAAFYSKMTMNVGAWGEGTGVLNINAENEGLDSELHLTINGGNINITSGNDGINTNEDGVSVTTINGGSVNIVVTGTTGEGDGIDSNGWLVINGGTVMASACGFSGDSGIDSDMGIHVNGGTVLASGNMLDRLEDGGQNYAVFTFAQTQSGGNTYTLKNADGTVAAEYTPANDFSILVVSAQELTAGEYTFWQGETQLAASSGMGGFGGMMGGQMGGMMNGQRPVTPGGPQVPEEWEGLKVSELPQIPATEEGTQPAQTPDNAEDMTPPELPEGMEEMTPPEDMELPEGMENMGNPGMPAGGMENGQRPDGMKGGFQGGDFGGRNPGMQQGGQMGGELSTTFTIADGANYFSGVTAAQ